MTILSGSVPEPRSRPASRVRRETAVRASHLPVRGRRDGRGCTGSARATMDRRASRRRPPHPAPPLVDAERSYRWTPSSPRQLRHHLLMRGSADCSKPVAGSVPSRHPVARRQPGSTEGTRPAGHDGSFSHSAGTGRQAQPVLSVMVPSMCWPLTALLPTRLHYRRPDSVSAS